jgi:uncharacterized protein YecE (DUF72 family)
MSKAGCDIRIGTSGWYYEHWKELFYPKDLPKSKWFEFYAKTFDTVELNNTFYHLPKEKSVERWKKIAPENFVYAVKASRFITHIKKLKDAAESLKLFFDRIDLLKNHLGVVLYQLPPSLHFDVERLKAFLKLLSTRRARALSRQEEKSSVFEFRHKSWYCDETYKLLEKFNAGFCIHDMPGNESPRVVTSDIIYVRFHGTSGRYSGDYPESQLKDWAHWLAEQSKNTRSIYVYFNNDAHAFAIKNAKQLKEFI